MGHMDGAGEEDILSGEENTSMRKREKWAWCVGADRSRTLILTMRRGERGHTRRKRIPTFLVGIFTLHPSFVYS